MVGESVICIIMVWRILSTFVSVEVCGGYEAFRQASEKVNHS